MEQAAQSCVTALRQRFPGIIPSGVRVCACVCVRACVCLCARISNLSGSGSPPTAVYCRGQVTMHVLRRCVNRVKRFKRKFLGYLFLQHSSRAGF